MTEYSSIRSLLRIYILKIVNCFSRKRKKVNLNLTEKEKALLWMLLLVQSLYNELRSESKFDFADQIRKRLIAYGLKVKDIPIKQLKEYKEGYRKHRNMFNAALYELEMFE